MNAVRSIEVWIQGDALKDEGHQRDVVPRGQSFEDARKVNGVLPPVPRRHHHAAQQYARALPLRPLDDRGQVLLDLGNRDPTQPIVGAKLDDQDAGGR
jgi:hypothetical protein